MGTVAKNNKIRIAMISLVSDPVEPVGGRQSGAGASVYIYELARILSKKGFHVDIFTRWSNRKTSQIVRIAQRCKIIRLKAGPRHYIPKENLEVYTPEFIEHFLAYVRENKIHYNLINSHQYVSAPSSVRLKEILGVPWIHTLHALGKAKEKSLKGIKISPDRLRIEKMILKESTQIVSTSPKEKILIVKSYGNNGASVNVIPAGFNPHRFNKLDKKVARKSLNISLEENVILFAARMDEDKGGLVLLDAIKWIKTYNSQIYNNIRVFMLSGDPRKTHKNDATENLLRKKLLKKITDYELNSKVALFSAVDQQTLHRYYASADIVVMPSYYESFGMVALEAMAMGVPVIASNVGGLQCVVHEGITGLHARPGNSKDFGQKIVHLLKNPKIRERMGENSSILASQNFSWDIVSDQIIKLYNKVLERN